MARHRHTRPGTLSPDDTGYLRLRQAAGPGLWGRKRTVILEPRSCLSISPARSPRSSRGAGAVGSGWSHPTSPCSASAWPLALPHSSRELRGAGASLAPQASPLSPDPPSHLSRGDESPS